MTKQREVLRVLLLLVTFWEHGQRPLCHFGTTVLFIGLFEQGLLNYNIEGAVLLLSNAGFEAWREEPPLTNSRCQT